MTARNERNFRNMASISEITGLTSDQVEKKLASRLGMTFPSAGLPNHEAIREAFGFSLSDLYPDKSRRPYLGKPRRKGKIENTDWHGAHDESGADNS